MANARLTLESSDVPAAEALARAYTLLAELSPERPALLYGAALADAALVLGAFQHAPHALRVEALDAIALPVVRRQSGGACVWGGAGVLYFALGLLDASVLMACPPGKLLNRNVRGFLAGMRELGVPAHYFGRDFISLAMQPGAYVGWEQAEDGRVLLEFFLGHETVFMPANELSGYPERSEPALRGKTPVALARVLPEARSAADVLAAIAAGYARGFGLEPASVPIDENAHRDAQQLSGGLRVDAHAAGELRWSSPREDAIGFVSAGVRLDRDGRIAALELGGDFFQTRAAAAQLAPLLLGHAPTADTIGAALDRVYTAAGALEGIRSLTTLREALLDACERALGTAAAQR